MVRNVQLALKDARPKPQQDCQRTKCYAWAGSVLHHAQTVFQ